MNHLLSFAIVGILSLFMVNGVMAADNRVQTSKGQIEANPSLSQEKIRTMTGEIQAIDLDENLLVLKNRRFERGFYFDQETQVKKGRKFMKQQDLELGMKVKVAYREIGEEKKAQLVRIQK